jgi:hypothetical protein
VTERPDETLAAARTGVTLGLGGTGAVVVWLGASAFAGAAPPDAAGLGPVALRGLWLALALAIAGAGPRGVASRPRPGIVGLMVMLAVPLPLYLVLWLADAVSPPTLLRGIAALLAGALGVPVLAALVRRMIPADDGARMALGALEVGLAAAAWWTSAVWLGWVGG